MTTVINRIKAIPEGTMTVQQMAEAIGSTQTSVRTAAWDHKKRTGKEITFAPADRIANANWRKIVALNDGIRSRKEIAIRMGMTGKELNRCISRARKTHGVKIDIFN